MLELISIAISSIICAVTIGYLIGQNGISNVERKNFKLEIQNKVLVKEYNKLYGVLEHFKDKRNDVLVDDRTILIYYPLNDNEFIEELGDWLND